MTHEPAITRRAVLLGAAGALAAPAIARGQGQVRLTLGHNAAAGNPRSVAAERMASGQIESLRVPANPLDVLAQQTVAAVALESVGVEEWFDIVRRSAPFATLPRSAYEATLDLLSGLLLAASPWLFGFSEFVYVPHLVLGLLEIGAALMTKTTPYAQKVSRTA